MILEILADNENDLTKTSLNSIVDTVVHNSLTIHEPIEPIGKGADNIKNQMNKSYEAIMGPPGIAVYSLQLIVYCLRLISWLFAENLQISCDFLGGFEEKAYLCG